MVDWTDRPVRTARIRARDLGRSAAYSGMSNDHPLTLTVEQAGQVLGVGRSTAYELVRSGDLKCIRLRRRIVVPVAHLAESLGVNRDAVWATLGDARRRCNRVDQCGDCGAVRQDNETPLSVDAGRCPDAVLMPGSANRTRNRLPEGKPVNVCAPDLLGGRPPE